MILTQKQEAFAFNLYKGMKQREAWGKAGYSTNYSMAVLDVHASQLAAKDKIKIRVAELHKENRTDEIADVEERKRRLSEFIRANLTDFTDENGAPRLDTDVPHYGAAREFYHRTKYGKFGNPTVTKSIKLVDPISAITELNKMERIYEFSPVSQDNRTINIIVIDGETKDLISKVKERTAKLLNGVVDEVQD